ncbi:MAG: efflux RND transporter permease subunit, partial [Dermatophilus congolensis]|nr:efflux RND transporter permease subunit [Dermatophilus congolensis]
IPQFPQVPQVPQIPAMPSIPMPTIPTPTPTAPTITTLGDVATVELKAAQATSISRTDGRPSVGLAIVKVPGASTVDISHEVRALIPELEQSIPGGRLAVVFDQAPFIEQSISDLTHEGMLGLLMAVLVVFAFLLSVRLTLVTAVSIPASLLAALIGLQATGYTLNILTLGALTIAIGRVVDDSIVVVENIKRQLDLGKGRTDAIITGVREVASAITASTIATVAVFLPIGLVGGESGELFRPFAVTVGLAMGASLLIALTIVPVLAYWFVKPNPAALTTSPGSAPGSSQAGAADGDEPAATDAAHDDEHAQPGRMERFYLPSLAFALRRPLVTMGIAVLALALAGAGATQLKTEFIGDAGQNSLRITQRLPAGSTLTAVDAAATKVEKVLAENPQVSTTMVTIGGGDNPFGGGSAGVANFSLTLADGADNATLAEQLRTDLTALEGVGDISVGQANGMAGSSAVQIAVRAPDADELRTAAEQVTEAMKSVEGVSEVGSDLGEQVPTLAVQVDRAKALARGVTETQVGQKVSTAVEGSTLGRVEFGDASHDVVLHEKAPPTDLKGIETIVVGADYKGDDVLLRQVASVERELMPASMRRIDGNRAVIVSVQQSGDDLGALTRNIEARLGELTLPAGATATVGGAAADQQEAFSQLGLAMLAAIAITYVVMVATFGSLAQPFMLLISIPFAAIGAVAALLIADTPLGVPAIIGLLMLVGIVVTNAIVLIDRVNQHRRAGLGVREAVTLGARNRLRPIVMTALATILALVPMAMSVTGGGAFISQPLALVVIGGLISSTALTLLIVPVLYVLLENALDRMRRRRGEPDSAL